MKNIENDIIKNFKDLKITQKTPKYLKFKNSKVMQGGLKYKSSEHKLQS